MFMRIALVYDRVNKWGGAERVLLALKKIFPQAILFTSVYNKKNAGWARVFKIKTSFLQKIPFANSHHEIFAPLMPLAFESFTFNNFDLVISVTSEAAKGIITLPQTKHICICLTPTRYLWSGYKDYINSKFAKFLIPLILYLKTWDKIASNRPDSFIAISKEVQSRIKKYYKRESRVIYPPSTLQIKGKIKDKGYFLVVSRISKFTKYKHIEIAVKACSKLSLPLKVVGAGNSDFLKQIAGPTVEFVGKVTDQQLATYFANCKALIFPALEDFGLVMVEAQSFGKPVIAFKGGGALEIIKSGKTGIFFDQQNPSSLIKSLKKFNKARYNGKDCKKNAKRFSFAIFKKELKQTIADEIKNI